VATFHTSNEDSSIIKTGEWVVQSAMERVGARIAVSEEARRTLVAHIGGDAILIPNGVRVKEFANAQPLTEFAGEQPTIAFVGRVDEPRKGFEVLCQALPAIVAKFPDLRVLVAGPGDSSQIVKALPDSLQNNLVVFGELSDEQKARVFASADVYVAPNTGKESFGIILLEAMASNTPIVASDIVAFRDVLENGASGVLVPPADPSALAAAVTSLLKDKFRREALVIAGKKRVAQFDWPVLAERIVEVYESVIGDAGAIKEEFRGHMYGPLTKSGRADRKLAKQVP
jgi:phosphatidylinositol alpha-mannosyltransferase